MNLYKWDNNKNKFVKYEHCIQDANELSRRLSACFDAQKKNILYVINSFEIIIIDIDNNANTQIPVKLDYKTAVSGCVLFDDKLHIITVDNDKKCFSQFYLCLKTNKLLLNGHFPMKSTNYNATPFLYIDPNGIELYHDTFRYWSQVTEVGISCLWGTRSTKNKHPFIEVFADNYSYLIIHCARNELIINQYPHTWYIKDTQCPINAEYYVSCKQSLIRIELLLNGFFRRITKYKIEAAFIPVDITKLLNEYFVLYNIHLFDEYGDHWMISLDLILENIPQYIGIIKSYDKNTKNGKIEIKGKINDFSNCKFLPRIIRNCNCDNPSKIHKPVITALRNMFNQE